MTFETQLKLQAFLDGELPAAEARDIAALIARDPAAAALHAELQRTRAATRANELPRPLPETREFYWSKIRREIERTQPQPVAPEQPGVAELIRNWFRPAGALVAVALVALLLMLPGILGSHPATLVASISDSDAITFQDESTGTTFVWLSYPAENGVAEPAPQTTLDTP